MPDETLSRSRPRRSVVQRVAAAPADEHGDHRRDDQRDLVRPDRAGIAEEEEGQRDQHDQADDRDQRLRRARKRLRGGARGGALAPAGSDVDVMSHLSRSVHRERDGERRESAMPLPASASRREAWGFAIAYLAINPKGLRLFAQSLLTKRVCHGRLAMAIGSRAESRPRADAWLAFRSARIYFEGASGSGIARASGRPGKKSKARRARCHSPVVVARRLPSIRPGGARGGSTRCPRRSTCSQTEVRRDPGETRGESAFWRPRRWRHRSQPVSPRPSHRRRRSDPCARSRSRSGTPACRSCSREAFGRRTRPRSRFASPAG